MISTSNQLAFSTIVQNYDSVVIASGTASAYTLVTTGISRASVITDILFKSADASVRLFNIIICPTGSQATAQYSVLQISVAANSGNNGSTSVASLANLAPQLFDIDLAGNRIIILESGISIYVQHTTTTAGAITLTAKRRDF